MIDRDKHELAGVRLGDVYRDAHGELWEVIALCDQPQAAIRRVRDGVQEEHVIGCLNWTERCRVGPMRPPAG